MKKILITGSSGYIGSHLCHWLRPNYEIHGVDLNPSLIPVNDFYQVDINRLHSIPDQLEPYDAIIHLAALVNVNESERTPSRYYVTNLNGTSNILNRIPTKNFIFASTGAAKDCYSAYGISKRAAEDVVREFCNTYDPKPYTIFRFYNVAGAAVIKPTNSDALFFNLMKAESTGYFTIFGNNYNTRDGTCLRDYVHVNEICQAIETAIENPSNSIANLGHGVGYTVKEIAEIYKQVNGANFELRYGPRRAGDLESLVLDKPSPYLKKFYTIEELLKRNV